MGRTRRWAPNGKVMSAAPGVLAVPQEERAGRRVVEADRVGAVAVPVADHRIAGAPRPKLNVKSAAPGVLLFRRKK